VPCRSEPGSQPSGWLVRAIHYAVVGHPERKYLWILSRTPMMDRATYDAICSRLVKQGYDPGRLLLGDGTMLD